MKLALTLAGIAVAATGCGGSDTTATASSSSTAPQTTTAAPPAAATTSAAPAPVATTPAPVATTPAPAAPAGLSDKSFTATEPTSIKDQTGLCTATGRVTNTSSGEKSAVVTFTLLKDGKTVAALQGAAQGVAAGKTATVQLISTSACGKGPYMVEFQVDTEY